jgi:ubiquinol-cytochrome c reductase iron-sulfur subunit
MAASSKKEIIQTRREFLYLTASSMGLIGLGAACIPFISSMNPSADTLAHASVEVDIANIPAGEGKTILWREKPVFIRHRTPEEMKAVRSIALKNLIDPASDEERVKPEHPEWLVVVGVCTHLGCVPLGQKMTEKRGEYGGWFCPCHGSEYDASGRVRKGPAPQNLEVPPYEFVSNSTLRIGSSS